MGSYTISGCGCCGSSSSSSSSSSIVDDCCGTIPSTLYAHIRSNCPCFDCITVPMTYTGNGWHGSLGYGSCSSIPSSSSSSSSSSVFIYPYDPEDGVIHVEKGGGGAGTNITLPYAGGSGQAQPEPRVSGSAGSTVLFTYLASGSVILGETSAVTASIALAVAGDLVVSGEALAVLIVPFAGSGAVRLAETSAAVLAIPGAPTGDLALRGEALVTLSLPFAASGAVRLSATVAGVWLFAPTGDIRVTGTALVAFSLPFAATGAVLVANSAASLASIALAASGDLRTTGAALVNLTLSHQATGGLRLSNTATMAVQLGVLAASGDLRLSNTAPATISIPYKCRDGLRFSNAATYKLSYAYTMTGYLRVRSTDFEWDAGPISGDAIGGGPISGGRRVSAPGGMGMVGIVPQVARPVRRMPTRFGDPEPSSSSSGNSCCGAADFSLACITGNTYRLTVNGVESEVEVNCDPFAVSFEVDLGNGCSGSVDIDTNPTTTCGVPCSTCPGYVESCCSGDATQNTHRFRVTISGCDGEDTCEFMNGTFDMLFYHGINDPGVSSGIYGWKYEKLFPPEETNGVDTYVLLVHLVCDECSPEEGDPYPCWRFTVALWADENLSVLLGSMSTTFPIEDLDCCGPNTITFDTIEPCAEDCETTVTLTPLAPCQHFVEFFSCQRSMPTVLYATLSSPCAAINGRSVTLRCAYHEGVPTAITAIFWTGSISVNGHTLHIAFGNRDHGGTPSWCCDWEAYLSCEDIFLCDQEGVTAYALHGECDNGEIGSEYPDCTCVTPVIDINMIPTDPCDPTTLPDCCDEIDLCGTTMIVTE